MEELDFGDLAPVSVPCKIAGKPYTIREVSAAGARAYRKACMSGATMDGNKVSGLAGTADAETILISHCLFEVYEAGGEKKERPVTLIQILAWPDRVTKPLFEECKKLSPSLKEEGKKADQEKNLNGSSEPTSSLHTNLESTFTR